MDYDKYGWFKYSPFVDYDCKLDSSIHDSFDNLLLADCQSDLLDNNTLTNANKDVQIGPNPSLDSEV